MIEEISKARKFNLYTIYGTILFVVLHSISAHYSSAMGFAFMVGIYLGSKYMVEILEMKENDNNGK